jgi:outer membrane protein insertion porin family
MQFLLWFLLLLLLPAMPAHAQEIDVSTIPIDSPRGLDSLSVHAGRTVRAVEIPPGLRTKEYVIRREIRTRVGQPFDPATLREDVQRLENLSIFAEVTVAVTADTTDGVGVGFGFREMPLFVPMLAFRYTEEDGFSIGPGVSSLNLGGRAVALSGRAYFGAADQFWGRVTWPWIAGNHVSFEAYAAHLSRFDVRNEFHETSDEIYARAGRYLGDHGRLAARAWFLQMHSDEDGITLSPDDMDQLFGLYVTAGLDTRDSWRMPRSGWQNEVELGKVGGFLPGEGDFESLVLDVRRWMPTGRTTKLQLSGLLSIQSGTVGVDVPTYMRYQIGGANSVRGYPVQGPAEALAGRNQLIGTAEHSFTIRPVRRYDVFGWSFSVGLDAVALADAGLAWNSEAEFALDRVRTGFGGGLRLLVPGSEMLRFEVAWDARGDEIQFHFASGSKAVAQRSRNR